MNVHMSTSTYTWLRSMLAAAIAAIGSSVSTCLVAPNDFNLVTWAGARHVLMAAMVAALIAVALYLKQSPLPPSQRTVQESLEKRDGDGNVVEQSSSTKTITTTPGGV